MANSKVKLVHYQVFGDHSLRLDYSNGQELWVRLDEGSGKVVTRLKKDTISNVQHTGIWLGTEQHSNTPLVLHNHYLRGNAHVVTLDDYAAGQQVFWKDNICTNDWLIVVKKGLDDVIAGRPYQGIGYNCQIFTNRACHNQHRSEDVEKWAARILAGFALIFFGSLAVRAANR